MNEQKRIYVLNTRHFLPIDDDEIERWGKNQSGAAETPRKPMSEYFILKVILHLATS